MNTAQIAGFGAGYLLFTTMFSTILILTNRINFNLKSIIGVIIFTAAITAAGFTLKNYLQK